MPNRECTTGEDVEDFAREMKRENQLISSISSTRDEKAQRNLWKLSQVRKIIRVFEKGRYGDDEAIATYAALNDIIQMVKEDE